MSTTSIIDYYKNNKDLEIVDIFKFIYQSVFGCEHLVLDYEKSLEFMLNEWENAAEDDLPDIEFLDGDFCRVHLKMMQDIDSLKKLCLYFVKSSETVSNGTDKLKEKIDELLLLCQDGQLSYDINEVCSKIDEWSKKDFCPIHHSERFRCTHKPAYRVIKKDFLNYLLKKNN